MKADTERPNHACKFTSVVCYASLDLCLISCMVSYTLEGQQIHSETITIISAKRRLLFCFVQTLRPEGWISQVFTGWYNSTVLKMPIPATTELEVGDVLYPTSRNETCSFICYSFIYFLQSNSRSLM